AWICWIHRRPTTYVTAEIRPPDVTLLPILPYAVDLSHPGRAIGAPAGRLGRWMAGGSKVVAASQDLPVPVPFSGVMPPYSVELGGHCYLTACTPPATCRISPVVMGRRSLKSATQPRATTSESWTFQPRGARSAQVS